MINLILIAVFHYIADFLCQTREMATNKSKSVYWLTIHVLTYATVSTLGWIYFNSDLNVLYMVWTITFLSHWMTDFITSKISSYFYSKNNMFGFFGTIGLVNC